MELLAFPIVDGKIKYNGETFTNPTDLASDLRYQYGCDCGLKYVDELPKGLIPQLTQEDGLVLTLKDIQGTFEVELKSTVLNSHVLTIKKWKPEEFKLHHGTVLRHDPHDWDNPVGIQLQQGPYSSAYLDDGQIFLGAQSPEGYTTDTGFFTGPYEYDDDDEDDDYNEYDDYPCHNLHDFYLQFAQNPNVIRHIEKPQIRPSGAYILAFAP